MEAGWGLCGQAPIQGTGPAPSWSGGEATSAGREGRREGKDQACGYFLGIFLDYLVVLIQVGAGRPKFAA